MVEAVDLGIHQEMTVVQVVVEVLGFQVRMAARESEARGVME